MGCYPENSSVNCGSSIAFNRKTVRLFTCLMHLICLFYFPWFVTNNTCPKEALCKNLYKFGTNIMSAHHECRFASRIPQNLFEIVSVQLQKTATNRSYKGERYAWKEGLRITMGTMTCILQAEHERATISFSVTGTTQDAPAIWLIMKDVNEDLKDCIRPYDGLIEEIYFLCSHCIILKQTICRRTPEEVLHHTGPDVAFLKCGGDQVPRGLIQDFTGEKTGILKQRKHHCLKYFNVKDKKFSSFELMFLYVSFYMVHEF